MKYSRRAAQLRDDRLGVNAFSKSAGQMFEELRALRREHFSENKDVPAIMVSSAIARFSEYFTNRFTPVKCMVEAVHAPLTRKLPVLRRAADEFYKDLDQFPACHEALTTARLMDELNETQTQALGRMQEIVSSLEHKVKIFIMDTMKPETSRTR